MYKIVKYSVCFNLIVLLMMSSANAADLSPEVMQFFEKEVRPLLSEHCWSCHGEKEQKGALRLDTRGHLLLGGESGKSIIPGKPDESLLIEAVRYESYEMPPSGKLKENQIKVLEKWVSLGAPWPGADDSIPVRKEHGPGFTDEDRTWWAIQPLQDVTVPVVSDGDWCRNEVDQFILSRLRQNGLSPAPEAGREALIRRVYFDLHGLPPTPTEVQRFLDDQRPDAYERLVDLLLESPRYGERWARHWLDVVRYADSDGYRADGYRPNAWRYRDYVIRSLNEDKPYNQFVQEQLAGDELFPNDVDAQIATGFLTHGIYEWNSRDVAGQWDIMLNELTDTVGDVFLGVGMQCAKCHDHKFDPILQKDYFQLRAFFEPILIQTGQEVATPKQLEKHRLEMDAWEQATKKIRKELTEIEVPYREQARAVIKSFPPDIQTMISKPEEKRSPLEQQLVKLAWRQVEHNYKNLDKKLKPADKERVLALRRNLKAFDKLKPAPLPVAQQVSDVGPVAPKTMIPKKRTECEPGFLTILDETSGDEFGSPSQDTTGRRSALARWLTQESNPLSTRVIVNRIWQYHFRKGLAPHSSDLGRLGGPPSHPDLLDWLTRNFLDDGWRFKRLHRLIVTSATYRQSTQHPQENAMASIDPANKFYWSAETRRLDAEQIRDSILAVTGQLNLQAGGSGVTPSVPKRSIYLRMMRNSRDPLLEAFDLPRFFVSVPARDTTTSPVQSLQLFNSQQMLRFADQLSKRAYEEVAAVPGTERENAAVRRAWEIVFGRPVTKGELSQATTFLNRQSELLAEQETTVNLQQLETATMPYRTGQSVVFHADKPSSFYVVDDKRLTPQDCTIEAFFQIRSVYESGAVRTLVSKWSGKVSEPGWLFGVTGRGSRRKPQTLVFRTFGRKSDGTIGDEIVFSDQHIEFNTPYYAAVSFHVSGERAGEIDFYLKDLSNDDEQLGRMTKKHKTRQVQGNNLPLAIGRMVRNRNSLFDGLIDDIRISSQGLDVPSLLFTQESVTKETLGYWKFDPVPGMFQDSSPNQHNISQNDRMTSSANPRREAFVDLCHILLNSNEFLYVH
ncbi:DUF1549 domain-containing protein [Gimesia fumaroli]|uniref:Planctomycete cytochrome C n=1 Tax=Gimesia fumaroli TaxID=2527976 RepID=A0A518IDL7_9PLAN|nr:DUF1549 domain-containing protein [Gimesia fumaroli]QDV51188.1 Planctomycete cytochrome C [Gimesia fumaroli]